MATRFRIIDAQFKLGGVKVTSDVMNDNRQYLFMIERVPLHEYIRFDSHTM